ncbi:MAG: isochorismatase family protein [Clostridium sp.]|nr:isochorismatase family protein [Clostridium sp.]
MKKLLLTVDPQIDFITGSLPVPGAAEAMDRLAQYISGNDGMYLCKIITADRHPYDHFSFAENGGPWPRHCVHDTTGAAVWQPVFDALYQTSGPVAVLYKGQRPDVEEYSIFRNREAAREIDRLIRDLGVGQIDICGLAGDVCVSETLRDGAALYGRDMFCLLTEFSPRIDRKAFPGELQNDAAKR